MIRFFRTIGISVLAIVCAGLPVNMITTRVHAQELDLEPDLDTRYRDPIPEELESGYIKGIEYLMRSQDKSGQWKDMYGQQPGVIGLAVLSILAHGDDPNSGPYSLTIKRGIDAILKQQNSSTGYIGQTMYNHGFATLALAETYGMMDDPRIGPALVKAVELIIASQKRNPTNAWRYGPDARDADTTVSGAQMVALFAARNAGIAVPDEAIKKGLGFFTRCQSPDGGFGYTGPGGSNATRTAIGVLVLSLSREYDSVPFKAASRYLKKFTSESSGYYEFYHEYYMSQALFQSDESLWDTWNKQNMKRMLARQQSDGSWQSQHGATFGTACALLSMALNYRYLPIYEKDTPAQVAN